MTCTWSKHQLHFKTPSGTSRGVLSGKDSWFIQISQHGKTGVGECSIIEGLSPETPEMIENILEEIPRFFSKGKDFLLQRYSSFPAIQFAIEMIFSGLASSHPLLHFDTPFIHHQQMIPINGLIWMSDVQHMKNQIENRLNLGFSCIKIKIGAIDFESECKLLDFIRNQYDGDIELRVDANGAFRTSEALQKIDQLSKYQIHSIEQPIAPGQWDEMANICRQSPIPIALDEELIGVSSQISKEELLRHIMPQYIVLKPSLIGGWQGADQWIAMAEKHSIGWWATSALESNIGLNAIAQWVSTKKIAIPQGLGTGSLFTNNIDTPLYLSGQHMGFDIEKIEHFSLK
jgi:O-succinylbenzoate synthase